jgi:hypothetical protein
MLVIIKSNWYRESMGDNKMRQRAAAGQLRRPRHRSLRRTGGPPGGEYQPSPAPF